MLQRSFDRIRTYHLPHLEIRQTTARVLFQINQYQPHQQPLTPPHYTLLPLADTAPTSGPPAPPAPTWLWASLEAACRGTAHRLPTAFKPTPTSRATTSGCITPPRGGVEYGDYSSSMGYCCTTRCFNTPNNWQLGWATPVTSITAANLAPGQTQTVSIPLAHTATANLVQIAATWQGGASYWVGYRGSTTGFNGYDINLQSAYANKVNVYQWDGTNSTFIDFTYHLASLTATGRVNHLHDWFIGCPRQLPGRGCSGGGHLQVSRCHRDLVR
jgi:hypothetical protein